MKLEPALFLPEAIDSQTRAFVDELRASLTDAPDMTKIPAPLLREARERGESIFGMFVSSDRAVDRTIPGPDGPLLLRVVEPSSDPRAVLLHIHGGGWMLGAAHHRDLYLVELADLLGIVTVSVGYRLAPEHPYPAGPDDCEAAALWLTRHGATEYGTDRLMIGGESAGAHLSAVTMLRMRDRHDYAGFTAANLVYGQYDLAGTPSVNAWGDEMLVLSTKVIEWFGDNFLGKNGRSDPDVSPIHADLAGLAPALFTVGTLDPLLDDSLFMAQRWAAAGNQAELAIYPGGVHAFDYWDEPLGRRAVAKMIDFMADHLIPAEHQEQNA